MASSCDYEQKLIESYRKKGYEITEEDLKEVRERCAKMMKLISIPNRQLYMPMLFMDEMKNHIYCKTIHECSMEIIRVSQELANVARDMQKKMEVFQDVCDLQKESV